MPRPPIQTNRDQGDPWGTIAAGLKDILDQKQSSLSLSALHNAVGKLVTSSDTKKLQSGLEEIMRMHFKVWYGEVTQMAGDPLVVRFSQVYEDFQNYCRIVPKFYMLYDRKQGDANGRSASKVIIRRLFIDCVIADDKLILALTSMIRKRIAMARSEHEVDLSRIQALLGMYYSFREEDPILPIFDKFFPRFQEEVETYYDEFFHRNFEGAAFEVYLQKASEQFAREEMILNTVLQGKEVDEILAVLHQQLLIFRESEFLEGPEPGIATAFQAANKIPIKWLVDKYKKFKSDDKVIVQSCARYIREQMLAQRTNFADFNGDKWTQKDLKSEEITRHVGELIGLTRTLTSHYETAFHDVACAPEELEKMIGEGWNAGEFDIVNNFATYLDSHIRNEFRVLSEEERVRFPAIVGQFYSRIQDKIDFRAMYDTSMVRRFIKKQTKLEPFEREIVGAIRRANAPDFASKFEDYRRRVQESKSFEDDFNTSRQHAVAAGPKVAFSPIVFENRDFPLGKGEVERLPPECQAVHDAFAEFHTKRYQKTKLQMLIEVSTIESKLQVPKNARSTRPLIYTLSADIPCTLILKMVAEKPQTMRAIVEFIGDRATVGKYLILLCGKGCCLLRRQATAQNLNDNDIFELNSNYYNKTSRVVIPAIVNERKIDANNNKAASDGVKCDAIHAAAVRVLKQRMRLEQTELETSVIDALAQHFRATVGMVRRGLTYLESNKYLTRETDGSKAMVNYIQ